MSGIKRLEHLNPYDFHKYLINEYVLTKPGSTKYLKRDTSRDKTDLDVIKENYKFLWNEDGAEPATWEEKLAKKYYDKLFKEYCICDLSRYKENKVAMRWRIEKEVVTGKGQFICGNKVCQDKEGLRSWEVNFAYVEKGESKNALVKLRLCESCSEKLNYHSKKREIKRLKKNKDNKKQKSRHSHEKDDVPSESTELEPNSSESQETSESSSSQSQNMPRPLKPENPDESIWSKKTPMEEEKTRDDEFDEFLQDLLL